MKKLMCAAGVVLAAGATSAQAGVLWGVGSFGAFSIQSLYRIDTDTGIATIVGSTGIDQIAGLAWDDSAGRMFAATTDGEIYLLNLTSGAAEFLSDTPGIFPEGDIAFGAGSLWRTDDNQLTQVNPLTGESAPLPFSMGPDITDISGLAFDGTGRLFAYSTGTPNDSLFEIDLGATPGAATLVGPTGTGSPANVGGMTFDPASGSMFLTDGASLYSVNTSTGVASLIGAHGVSGFSGLAIPAPSVVSFALVGVATFSRRRR